jgi:pyruvate dehydrogenase E2 component (dihydrolipoamide acetyltransferase)
MAEIVVMPKIGLTAREVLLREWLVDVGQQVEIGQPLCEIETDKILNEMESPSSGVLLKRLDSEVVVPVGEPIAVIGEAGEEVDRIHLYATSEGGRREGGQGEVAGSREGSAVPGGAAASTAGAGRVPSSPIARKLAKELRVDLSVVKGSGPGGRITRRDVEAAAGSLKERPEIGVGKKEAVTRASDTARRQEPTKLRRAIAAAMSLSAAIPQFSLERDVEIAELRNVLIARSYGLSASMGMADAIGVAAARSIRRHAAFLRAWINDSIESHNEVNLGLAVAVEDGLIVPVLRNVDQMSVEQFSQARRELQERTLSGKLRTHELSGAVFTLSNLGPFGVDRFRALVNPPESGILALGRARAMGDRTVLTLSLSADHRVVDGVQGAQLLSSIAGLLEEASGLRKLFSPPP